MNVKQSHIAWEGSSWRLRVDTLIAPDNTELDKGFIEHPGAVVLIPIRNSAAISESGISTGSGNEASVEVLMISQYLHHTSH